MHRAGGRQCRCAIPVLGRSLPSPCGATRAIVLWERREVDSRRRTHGELLVLRAVDSRQWREVTCRATHGGLPDGRRALALSCVHQAVDGVALAPKLVHLLAERLDVVAAGCDVPERPSEVVLERPDVWDLIPHKANNLINISKQTSISRIIYPKKQQYFRSGASNAEERQRKIEQRNVQI